MFTHSIVSDKALFTSKTPQAPKKNGVVAKKRKQFFVDFHFSSRFAPFCHEIENNQSQNVYSLKETTLIIAGSGYKFMFHQLKLMAVYIFQGKFKPLPRSTHNVNPSSAETFARHGFLGERLIEFVKFLQYISHRDSKTSTGR